MQSTCACVSSVSLRTILPVCFFRSVVSMAVPAVLVVSMTFEPPTISILGPIQESTIAKLGDQLPNLCTNSYGGRRPNPTFVRMESPTPHWTISMRGLVAEIPAKMAISLAILDALEEEGGWGFHGTHALTTDFEETHKLFFMRKSR